ncbi:ABC transporter substrate-binding protein [Pseudoclavibacter sp. 13-3]|uniref:ABC transporter substrate-binding protein n=1 Tax=Pseudoclavibacter sp. 13-3 TaxID=2901228 RepID=UPI001E397E71|nr:ABC transporter substrate-binding protein [Pseudoclavibacter sp. 13-3]MCD7101270.1 ABC transporter substrate-binding protein [Pseudoclavibacter sp. 13-3]
MRSGKHSRRMRPLAATFTTAALVMGSAFGVGTAAFAEPAQSAATTQAEGDSSSQVLRIATSGHVDSFNPFTSIYLTPTQILRNVYENLVQNDQQDGSPTKGLADSWTVEEDGKRWVYKMQSDLKWSDGQPITSADPKFTYEQMMNDSKLGTANGNLVSNFESVEAPDDQTLVINLKTPQAPNPGLEIPVVPKHVWEGIADKGDYANDTDVVGSGPFLLSSYSANQSITLKANDNFWQGRPKIDGIQYVYYTNSDAQVQALRSGDIDFVTGLSPTQFNALNGADGVTTHSGEGRRYTSISINSGLKTPEGEAYGTGSSALHDKAVRQAIRQGTDSEALLKQVLDGQGTVATSFIPSAFDQWHLPDDDSVIKSFDPDAAKQLLEDDGWKAGADGIREKDGQKLSLRLLVDADEPTEQSIAEYFKPWMQSIGIAVDVQSSDSDTISDRAAKGDYDMYFSGWSVNPDPDYQLGINTCENLPDAEGDNGTTQDGYCNPEFDKLYAQQRSEQDHDKRTEIVRDMLRMNYDDTAQVALWYGKALEAYRSDRFTGFGTQPASNGMIAGQAGYWSYINVEPASEAGSGSGTAVGLWVGAGVLVVVIIGGVIFFARRKKRADDVE